MSKKKIRIRFGGTEKVIEENRLSEVKEMPETAIKTVMGRGFSRETAEEMFELTIVNEEK